jgi:hypothetical protein
MLPRNDTEDEVLGLNCTWYADVLMTLTAPRPAAAAPIADRIAPVAGAAPAGGTGAPDATAVRPPAAGPA